MPIPIPLRVLAGLIFLSDTGAAAPPEPPDLRAATITLPYAEVRALWEAAHARPPAEKLAPPVSHVLSLARYGFEISADLATAECRATFEVTTFADGWVCVPLLPADVRIESVAPDASALALRDGFYTLFLNGPGKRSINIRFAARLTNSAGAGPGLRLAVAPALMAEASFGGVPAGSSVEVTDAILAGTPGAAAPTYRFGAASTIAFTVVGADRRARKAALLASWNADVQTIVAREEGGMVCRSRVIARGLEGDTAAMQLLLPATASVREVESENLERWESKRADGGQERIVSVRWSGPERVGRELKVLYELPLGPSEGEWTLSAPSVKGSVAQSSVFLIVARPGLEITPAAAAAGAIGVPEELSPAIVAALSGMSYTSIQAAPGEATALVHVRRLPLVAAAQARIDEAQFRMRVVPDGSVLTDATFTLRHERPLALRIEMPAGSELLACSLNGAESSPIDRGEGVLEFALPAAAGGKASHIVLSYSARTAKLAPVAGQVELKLPRTDLFTNVIAWEVQLPGTYELTAFEGNVEMASPVRGAGDASVTVVRLRKEICKGEAPRVALFYQKRGVTP